MAPIAASTGGVAAMYCARFLHHAAIPLSFA
jgi:hypothetical protein